LYNSNEQTSLRRPHDEKHIHGGMVEHWMNEEPTTGKKTNDVCMYLLMVMRKIDGQWQ
jgi:hypothetical protein